MLLLNSSVVVFFQKVKPLKKESIYPKIQYFPQNTHNEVSIRVIFSFIRAKQAYKPMKTGELHNKRINNL